MEEARRFLRYVMPGLILMLEVSFYLFLSSYEAFIIFIRDAGKDVAFPITAFLASGGIGFMMSVIYHTLCWTKGFQLLTMNYLPLVNDAVRRGWLKLQRRADGGEVDIEELTQAGAWCIVDAFWRQRKESSLRIKGATPRVDLLDDIMHGSGTTFIGSVIAIPFWVIAHIKLSVCGSFPDKLFFIPPLIVSYMHFVNFRKRVKQNQSVVEIIMSDELQEEFFEWDNPIVINISEVDLERNNIA